MKAAILGQNKSIRTLLNKGADIHARDKNGNTALAWAISKHDFAKTVKLLLQHEAKVDEKNNEGITPLMWAAALGLNNSVKLLLEKQANPNLLDNKGKSAFTWAVQNGHLDTAHLLLDSGRGKRKKISFYVPGMFIFNLPEKFEHSGIKLDIEKPISEEGENPLMLAIRFNNLSLVKRLIEMGSNINATDVEGLTPITLAALYESSSQIINLLVQAGANINNQSEEGKDFPLLFAAAYNNKELIEELLKNGANVHLKNIDGETPLFRASTLYFQINLIKDMEKDGLTPEPLPQDAAQKHAEIAKILIQHGANVNETNNENKTPLLWAVSLPGHAPIVKVLLDAGADIHHQNNKGRDALAIAKDTNDPEILKLLQEKLSQE
jgi:ankyrin repeat protein